MESNTHDFNFTKKNNTPNFLIVVACTLSIMMMISGCGESVTDAGNDTNDDENVTSNEVSMEGLSFVSENLTVEVGTTVVWKNNSDIVHTVTSGTDGNHDGLFDSGDLAAGEQFSYTFAETGTYPYFCIPHVNQGMTGTIIVEASGD